MLKNKNDFSFKKKMSAFKASTEKIKQIIKKYQHKNNKKFRLDLSKILFFFKKFVYF